MAVIRVEKNGNYTVMSNYHLKDKTMSLKTKGLLSLMLSLPDDWDYSVAGLVVLSSDGKDAVTAALKELEKKGYLERNAIREKGKIVDWEYHIYEHPKMNNKEPLMGKPQVEKPLTEKPQVEKPLMENPSQSNTKESNTKESNTKESNTKKRAKSRFKKSESYDEILKSLNNKDLEDAFKEFINMRNEMKKPLTPYALELAIKELFRLSKNQEEMVAIVNQSIQNSWLGLFPLRKNNNNTYQFSNQQSSNEFINLLNDRGF